MRLRILVVKKLKFVTQTYLLTQFGGEMMRQKNYINWI
jgi:hypothetical protein